MQIIEHVMQHVNTAKKYAIYWAHTHMSTVIPALAGTLFDIYGTFMLRVHLRQKVRNLFDIVPVML